MREFVWGHPDDDSDHYRWVEIIDEDGEPIMIPRFEDEARRREDREQAKIEDLG